MGGGDRVIPGGDGGDGGDVSCSFSVFVTHLSAISRTARGVIPSIPTIPPLQGEVFRKSDMASLLWHTVGSAKTHNY